MFYREVITGTRQLYDEHNTLVFSKSIDKEGNKQFLKGDKKKGCFFPIGMENINKHILIVICFVTGFFYINVYCIQCLFLLM